MSPHLWVISESYNFAISSGFQKPQLRRIHLERSAFTKVSLGLVSSCISFILLMPETLSLLGCL